MMPDGDELRAALASALMAERAHVKHVTWSTEPYLGNKRTTVTVELRGALGEPVGADALRDELHNLVRRVVEIDRLLGGNGVALVELDRALEKARP